MKRFLFSIVLAVLSATSFGTTLNSIALLNPAGSTSGQAIVSSGASSAPAWANVTASGLVAQAANTVVANVTGSSASPTAVAMPSCSTANSALKYTSATGFSCGTTYALTSGTLAQFAATTSAQLAGVISDETGSGAAVFATGSAINPTSVGASTPGSGAFTTLAASGAVSGTGFSSYMASPPAIGGTASAAGAFTTLAASGNDALFYTTTNAQSFANNTLANVTTWTKTFDRLNANFNAATGVFTAPVTGVYVISAGLGWTANVAAAACGGIVVIVANGVNIARSIAIRQSISSTSMYSNVTAVVSLTAGQTASVGGLQSTGAALTLSGSALDNFVSIFRLP